MNRITAIFLLGALLLGGCAWPYDGYPPPDAPEAVGGDHVNPASGQGAGAH
jgi:hypothetical protein